jgi:hypothetical protein
MLITSHRFHGDGAALFFKPPGAGQCEGGREMRESLHLDLILAITTYVLQFIATVCALAGSAKNHVEF